jgi:hypothetical protein
MNEPNSRFTLDGGDRLESRIRELCTLARSAVQRVIPKQKLEAMLLGGGYGRGEGGVFKTQDGESPYNDLEFYVCVKGSDILNARAYNAPLHKAAEHLSEKAGIEVEFKLFSLNKLRRSRVTMFYYDLVAGHKWIIGDESLLDDCKHHLAAHRIPLYEATRLLMNRCSGLLFAAERLDRPNFTPEDADFVCRNVAKAKLALGDVLLVARTQYHWSCRERHRRLIKIESEKGLSCLEQVLACHKEGVEFKLHPYKSEASQDELRVPHADIQNLAEQIWLWLESIRLKQRFANVREYSSATDSLCPETSPMKNVLINLKTFGPGSLASGQATHYPRERLLRSLPFLLWARNSTDVLPDIQRHLLTTATSFPDVVRAYRKIWNHYN